MKKVLLFLAFETIFLFQLFSQKDSLPEFELYTVATGASQGSALIDFNNDEKTDIFFGNRFGPNSIFINNGDFQFTKLTAGDIVNDEDYSFGISWGDYDNDGDLDLYVANGIFESTIVQKANRLYINMGDGSFMKDTTSILVQDTAPSIDCAWIDYNNDSYLDLYILNYTEKNQLFKGLGNSEFIEIFTGEIPNISSSNICVIPGDYNNDNYTDLYIPTKHLGHKMLLKNIGGNSFSMELSNPIMRTIGQDAGGSWGDYNNDGYLDLLAVSEAFRKGEKNSLFRNNGNETFTNKLSSPIAKDSSNSYGSSFADIDNDGDLDIYISNAYQINWFYQNMGDGVFKEITGKNFIELNQVEVGAIWDDLDNDGDLDGFIMSNGSGPNWVIKNLGNENNWVRFKLTGTCSNRNAFGAKVRIKSTIFGTSYWQLRELSSVSGARTQSSLTLHFGLGDATIIDSAIIEWPSGRKTHLSNLDTNTIHFIEEQQSIPENHFSVQPVDVTLCRNENAEFSCKSILLNKNITWQYSDGGAWSEINSEHFDFSIENDIHDVTKSILTIYDVPSSLNNFRFRCLIQDNCTMLQYTSNEATIAITNCFEFAGEVYAGNSLLEKGIVEMFSVEDSSFIVPAYSVEVVNGKFYLPEIKEGVYHFLVKPYGEEKEMYFPTYHYQAISKENSTPKIIDKNIDKEFFYIVERSCSPSTITSHIRIDTEEKNIHEELGPINYFGNSMDTLGDFNNDGNIDIVVAAMYHSSSFFCSRCGSIFLLFLDENQNIISYKNLAKDPKFNSLEVSDDDFFGTYVENIGDLDLDGVTDLFVTAKGVDGGDWDGNSSLGAYYIVFLNADGTIKNAQKVSISNNNLDLELVQYASFGANALCIGDKNNDSIPDILVSQQKPEDLFVIYLNRDGTVKETKTIYISEEIYTEEFDNSSGFGRAMEEIGDLDGDGIKEIAVSDAGDDTDFIDAGAIYILFLNDHEEIKKYTKISSSSFFSPIINSGDILGTSMQYLGDYFQNGTSCLAVSAPKSDMYSLNSGAIFLLSINNEGELEDYMIVKSQDLEFENSMEENTCLGNSITLINYGNEPILLVSNIGDDVLGRDRVGNIYRFNLCNQGEPVRYLSLSGYVYGEGLPIFSGTVKLYLTENPTNPKYTVDIVNGRFVFNNIEPGEYYMSAEPSGINAKYFTETFYVQTSTHDNAFPIDVYASSKDYTIDLLVATESENSFAEKGIQLYPNPAVDMIHIENISKINTISIVNVLGMEIRQYENNNNSMDINVSDLQQGIYLVQFKKNQKIISTHKINKE